jgi:hypothetical protein
MSDWNPTTDEGGHAPGTATAPRSENPYREQPAAYRPPVMVGQGGVHPVPQQRKPAAKSRESLTPEQLRAGDKAQQLSVVFGVLSFVTLPLLFGPLAIWQGNKAESFDRYGNAGRTLGWIATVLGLLSILAFVAMLMFLADRIGTSSFELLRFIALAIANPQAAQQAVQQAGV